MSSPEERMAGYGLKAEDFNFSGSQISADEKAKAQKIIDAALKLPDNRQCADCTSMGRRNSCRSSPQFAIDVWMVPGPRWASVNLGIFMCLECSGIHRRLGVHISKVKSVNLDGWKIKWAQVKIHLKH